MRKRPRRIENEQNKLRIEAIGKLFSMAVMTITTVVVVNIVVPQSPSASLSNINVFADRVSYRVDVVDPEQAINNDSLKVRLSNQLENYERPLPFGISLGAFDNLNPNTQYLLEVIANKGFGIERLSSARFKTSPRDGGAILDVRRKVEQDYFEGQIEIDVAVYNDEDTYQAFALRYAITYDQYQINQSTEDEQVLEYFSVDVTESVMTITINQYISQETIFYFQLVGYRFNDNEVVLDKLVNRSVFALSTYAGLNQVTASLIDVYFFADSRLKDTATYQALLYRDQQKIAEKKIAPIFSSEEYEEITSGVKFSNLMAFTTYRILIMASYINPDTLRQDTVVASEMEVTTSGLYSYQLNINDLGSYYVATVTLIDPHHTYQQFFYEIYQGDDHYPVQSNQDGFVSPENKTASLSITKPPFEKYRIIIGVRNNTDYYRYDVLKIISN